MKVTDRFILFYGGPFSQWYPCKFQVDGIEYNCAEQFMMASKARFFNDEETLKKIMATNNPREQKALGREVKNFNVPMWSKVSQEYVYIGNYAKFSQDEELKSILFQYRDREIVEASPTDKIWGIGLSENDPRCKDKSTWQGLNWLGECIMRVRKDLLEKSLG
jgi:ribA/ribD-fused uncharacterized protein